MLAWFVKMLLTWLAKNVHVCWLATEATGWERPVVGIWWGTEYALCKLGFQAPAEPVEFRSLIPNHNRRWVIGLDKALKSVLGQLFWVFNVRAWPGESGRWVVCANYHELYALHSSPFVRVEFGPTKEVVALDVH